MLFTCARGLIIMNYCTMIDEFYSLKLLSLHREKKTTSMLLMHKTFMCKGVSHSFLLLEVKGT